MTVLLDLTRHPSGYLRDQLVEGRITVMGAMPAGMTNGNPTVALFVETPSGRVVFAETSLKLLLTAADAFKAQYGDPRTDDELRGGAPS